MRRLNNYVLQRRSKEINYMKLPKITSIKTEDEARQLAIDWQQHVSTKGNYSYGELADFQDYFRELANKFKALEEEFKENGII